MKTKKIKQLTIFLLSLPLCIVLFGAGCERDMSGSSLSSDIGDLISVFELKYGDTKEFDYKGEKIVITIEDVHDSVSVNCSLIDFENNTEDPSRIKISTYLRVNNEKSSLKVESKSCGTILYKNDGSDIQDIEEKIEGIRTASANLTHDTYYTDTFINLFGEGTQIINTSYSIYLAKAFPVNYEKPDALISNYKFIFILTHK